MTMYQVDVYELNPTTDQSEYAYTLDTQISADTLTHAQAILDDTLQIESVSYVARPVR